MPHKRTNKALEAKRKQTINRIKLMNEKRRFDSLSLVDQMREAEQGNNPYEPYEVRSAKKRIFRKKRAEEMRKAGAPEALIRRVYGNTNYCTNAFHPGGDFIESNDALNI